MAGSAAEGLVALHECMRRCGTDQSSLLASINSAVGLRERDVVLAVGSVAEGLGNSKSDLDLLLVVSDEDAGPAETELCWAIGHRMVDLRVLHSVTIERLTSRLSAWARLPWNLAEQAPFSYEERVLLHRLLDGLEVHPARPHAQDHPWRPRRQDLARLKLKVARHAARTTQVDMVGYRDERDYATLVFAAQDLLGHGVDGLLAGYLLTNPNPKWRSRLLGQLPPDWERSLGARPAGLPADRVFWDLHRAPLSPEREPAISHASRCVAFARAAFAWAEECLTGRGVPRARSGKDSQARGRPAPGRPLPGGPLPGRPLPGGPLPGRPLPNLEFDVDFFFSDTGIAVARLNEFDVSLSLSEREFALLLLCDGQTPAAEAEIMVNGAVNGARDDGSEPLDVDAMVERLVRGGLCLTG